MRVAVLVPALTLSLAGGLASAQETTGAQPIEGMDGSEQINNPALHDMQHDGGHGQEALGQDGCHLPPTTDPHH